MKFTSKYSFIVFVPLFASSISAQQPKTHTNFCNPLNLSCRFQPDLPSRREAVDPSIVLFKGKYYLFASKSGGYWASDNLLNWSFITSHDLPWEDYAPTALVMNNAVYFMALDRRIYKSDDPMSGHWQIAKDSLDIYAGDPCLFLDDDNRLYLYHGLTNSKPIRGIKLKKKTFNPKGEKRNLLNTNTKLYGWELTDNYNNEQKRPFLEGAWMTKHDGLYYLQYASPGTQYKSYNDGLYISEQPLGPFKLADNNPFSYNPEGFICSAGHSSTFQDKYGNYRHTITMLIDLSRRFERRIVLFLTFFNKDKGFYTYTGFGDFPHKIPHKKMSGSEDYQPAGMLLSYNKPIEVSSALDEHPKEYANNENIQNYWSAKTGNKGEWIMIDLQQTCKVSCVQINYYDEATNILERNKSIYHQYLLEYSTDKTTWKTLADKTQNRRPPRLCRIGFACTSSIYPPDKLSCSGWKICNLQVANFWKGYTKKTESISSFEVVRDTADNRNVKLSWSKGSNVTSYNIRYGTSPNKLYENYQVMDTNSLTIHSLNALLVYYFTIDTFNDNGITKGKLL